MSRNNISDMIEDLNNSIDSNLNDIKLFVDNIHNEIYIYIWIICFYSIMLFLLILANLFMLLHILHYGKYIHNISGSID